MEEWSNRVTAAVKKDYGPYDPERHVLAELAKHPTVLEIGSGMGRYTKLLPHVVGLEYSRSFLRYCADNVPGVFLRGDGFHVPIRDNAFDCVFSSGVIEHFDDLLGITKEHARVCRPGGTVVIAVPAKDSPDAARVDTRQRYLRKGEQRDWHYYGRRLPDNEVRQVMHEAGLIDIQLRHLGTPLRGGREALAYLRPQLLRHPIAMTRGMALELGGYITARPIFKKLTADVINRRYSASHGHYLLASSHKPPRTPSEKTSPVNSLNDLRKILICPICGQAIDGDDHALTCKQCDVSYPIIQGIPYLCDDDARPAHSRVES